MKSIKIFLASSNELKDERVQFELEIYRKCKSWLERGIFLYLDIWEDLSSRMSENGSQSEYNKKVEEADIFILLAHTKVGMYTGAEFEQAFGQFKSTKKPFIYTYFKTTNGMQTEPSLEEFHLKLKKLKHFYSPFTTSMDLWNMFSKELDRLNNNDFLEFKIKPGKVNIQFANSIINIEKIQVANFT